MKQLVPILSDLSIVFFDLLIFTRLIFLKREWIIDKILMYAGCFVIIVAYFLATYVFGLPASISSALFMSIPSLLLFLYLSKHKDSRFFLTFCFVDSVSLIIGFFSRYVGVLLNNELTSDLIALFVTIALFLAFFLFGWKHFQKYHELLDIPNVGWRDMAIASALIYFGLIFFAAYPTPLVTRPEYGLSYAIFSLIVLSCYTVFISSIRKTKKIYDQNQLLAYERKFYKIAYTDSLTGLFNRASYVEKINKLNFKQDISKTLYCVALDLNNLKGINDTMGHQAGDRALQGVANAMRYAFADVTQHMFRLGGDEFAIIFEAASEAEVQEKIDALEAAMKTEQKKSNLPLSCAVGFDYLRTDVSDTLENAYNRADVKMYQHKHWQKENGVVPIL